MRRPYVEISSGDNLEIIFVLSKGRGIGSATLKTNK